MGTHPLCPVCHRPAAALVVDPELCRIAHALVVRTAPAWSPGDGICPRCIAAFRESARRLREREPLKSDGFREYRRYYLTRRESGQWNHVNPDMVDWWRCQILARVSAQAERDGATAWVLVDAGETLIAQGSGRS